MCIYIYICMYKCISYNIYIYNHIYIYMYIYIHSLQMHIQCEAHRVERIQHYLQDFETEISSWEYETEQHGKCMKMVCLKMFYSKHPTGFEVAFWGYPWFSDTMNIWVSSPKPSGLSKPRCCIGHIHHTHCNVHGMLLIVLGGKDPKKTSK